MTALEDCDSALQLATSAVENAIDNGHWNVSGGMMKSCDGSLIITWPGPDTVNGSFTVMTLSGMQLWDLVDMAGNS